MNSGGENYRHAWTWNGERRWYKCARPGCGILLRYQNDGPQGGLRRHVSDNGGLTWRDIGGESGRMVPCSGLIKAEAERTHEEALHA